MMKKILAMTMALAMVLCLAACGGTGSTSSNAASTGSASTSASGETAGNAYNTIMDGKLVMSTNAQFPPYEMVSDGEGVNGTGFEGIDVELACALANKLGLELVIDDMEFDSALMAVQEGRSDMVLAGLSYSEERDLVMDFTASYATGVQVVIVKEGSDVTMDNLGEKMIGTQRGTTGYIYASDSVENGGYGEDHVLAYDNGATAVQALMNGQIDAVIIDKAPAEEYVKANPGLTLLPTEWVTEDYCVAVNEGNTVLLTALDNALAELQTEGVVDTIIGNYINAEG